MTRGDLCAVLFGFAPVTAAQLARIANVSVEDVDAFYRTLRKAELVDLDEETGFWFRVREGSSRDFFAKVKALGIDLRESLDRPM